MKINSLQCMFKTELSYYECNRNEGEKERGRQRMKVIDDIKVGNSMKECKRMDTQNRVKSGACSDHKYWAHCKTEDYE